MPSTLLLRGIGVMPLVVAGDDFEVGWGRRCRRQHRGVAPTTCRPSALGGSRPENRASRARWKRNPPATRRRDSHTSELRRPTPGRQGPRWMAAPGVPSDHRTRRPRPPQHRRRLIDPIAVPIATTRSEAASSWEGLGPTERGPESHVFERADRRGTARGQIWVEEEEVPLHHS